MHKNLKNFIQFSIYAYNLGKQNEKQLAPYLLDVIIIILFTTLKLPLHHQKPFISINIYFNMIGLIKNAHMLVFISPWVTTPQ